MFVAADNSGVSRSLHIGANEIELTEHHPRLQLNTSILYHTLTDAPVAGLFCLICSRANSPLFHASKLTPSIHKYDTLYVVVYVVVLRAYSSSPLY